MEIGAVEKKAEPKGDAAAGGKTIGSVTYAINEDSRNEEDDSWVFALFENEQDSFSRLLVVDITTSGTDIAKGGPP